MLATIETGVELGHGERNCAGLVLDNFSQELISDDAEIRVRALRVYAVCTQIGSEFFCQPVPQIVEFGLHKERTQLGDTCQTSENTVGVR